jgi:hypothetical protein
MCHFWSRALPRRRVTRLVQSLFLSSPPSVPNLRISVEFSELEAEAVQQEVPVEIEDHVVSPEG